MTANLEVKPSPLAAGIVPIETAERPPRGSHGGGGGGDDAAARLPAMYAGLSPGQRLAIVMSAIVLVLLNMAFGAYIMSGSADRLPFSDTDKETVTAFSKSLSDPVAAALIRAKSIDAVLDMKAVGNNQAIVIVAFAGAFSLFAIGFALFVLGADGAFKLHSQGTPAGNLLLTGTAPGLFCFALAAALIATGMLHHSTIANGATELPAGPAKLAADACTNGDCATDALFRSDGTMKAKPGAAK